MPINHIEHDELKQMLQHQPHLQLVDVRTEWEFYVLGHIPQAQLVPMDRLPTALSKLNRHQDIVLICQHGIRSAAAAEYFATQGFNRVHNVISGMEGWTGPVTYNPTRAEEWLTEQEREGEFAR